MDETLRSIVTALADSNPITSDADGFDYCAICKSSEEYGGVLQHEGDCPYLRALLVRQAEAEKAHGEGGE